MIAAAVAADLWRVVHHLELLLLIHHIPGVFTGLAPCSSPNAAC